MKHDNQERIICAAIYYDDGKQRRYVPRNIKTGFVASGWRHGNCIPQMKEMFYDKWTEDPDHDKMRVKVCREWIQGFLTTHNRFVDRTEGARIAKAGNQFIRKETNYLFSEDIY